MNKYMEEAKKIKESIQGLGELATDEAIVQNKEAFPLWNGNGIQYSINYIVRHTNDKVYKVIQPHTSQNDWAPDVAVSLFVEISTEEWPLWKQPTGAHDAYAFGSKVSWPENEHWVSDMDANVYEPGVYGWHKEI